MKNYHLLGLILLSKNFEDLSSTRVDFPTNFGVTQNLLLISSVIIHNLVGAMASIGP